MLEQQAQRARETGKGEDAFPTPDYSLPVSASALLPLSSLNRAHLDGRFTLGTRGRWRLVVSNDAVLPKLVTYVVIPAP
eukprot:709442-Pelagomonas_calceolata.AAC.2